MNHHRSTSCNKDGVLPKGPFMYYVITFLGFLDPPSPLRLLERVFSTENNQKLAFSDPPPPTSDYVIYEWSLRAWRSTNYIGGNLWIR